MNSRSAPVLAHIVLGSVVASAAGGDAIKTLLITGQNNHNWQFTSRVHEETLESTGRFDVDVTDNPASTLADGAGLGQYKLFVLDYNGERWGSAAEANFAAAVKAGTGVVVIHASNNAFVGWTDYEKVCGLMWVNGTTGHGAFHPYDVTFVDHEHPITKGLADFKLHPDELYHKLVNTQSTPFKLLAQARSSTESRGTGKDEPMALTLAFGQGRVFHTPLGHVWTGDDASKSSVVDPQFKILLARGAEWAGTGEVSLGEAWKDSRQHNTLTKEEQAAGWTLLFDGATGKGWHGFKAKGFPEKNWQVREGVLVRKPGEEGPDIVTDGEYSDFEFACDWKVAKNGNSGIIYRTTEDHDYSWQTGPEYQILDDSGHADGKKPKTRAGTLYDVIACTFDVCRPAGEWNHARIVVKGGKVEHWLNGFKIVETDTTGEDYKKAVAASKWAKSRDYGSKASGHIALQDHGDEVMFRDIKIRELK